MLNKRFQTTTTQLMEKYSPKYRLKESILKLLWIELFGISFSSETKCGNGFVCIQHNIHSNNTAARVGGGITKISPNLLLELEP